MPSFNKFACLICVMPMLCGIAIAADSAPDGEEKDAKACTYQTGCFQDNSKEGQLCAKRCDQILKTDHLRDLDGNYSYAGFEGILIKAARMQKGPNFDRDPFGGDSYYLDEKSVNVAFDLVRHMVKCEADSPVFAETLEQVAETSSKFDEPLRLAAVRAANYPLGVAGNPLEGFDIDLDDIRVFPDPIRQSPDGDFEKLPGVPPWAEYLCSFLGHELAEYSARRLNYLAAKKAGREYDLVSDRKNHHYEVANPVSDRISKDYFQSNRERGADCDRTHGDHKDTLIEIRPKKAIIIHGSPSIADIKLVKLEQRWGKFYGTPHKIRQIDRLDIRRISHISYEEDFVFPKVQGSKCL